MSREKFRSWKDPRPSSGRLCRPGLDGPLRGSSEDARDRRPRDVAELIELHARPGNPSSAQMRIARLDRPLRSLVAPNAALDLRLEVAIGRDATGKGVLDADGRHHRLAVRGANV